ncbi:serine acetyltransferase [Paucibacter sp. PLA-PC-4]|uniref:serine O-acetyltransferase n=1 Tax=Paucibacter sp. PLA-PC-4 TaxID=2993655 RepID=UPI00224A803B|nr:serine acetyltransferase [Paucibacter sp. PLA-PC-4]MCX2865133.1 serine acetyltransferase [Paucibacter sp. PLA-PC-4]
MSQLLSADLDRLRTPAPGQFATGWRARLAVLNPRFFPVLIIRLARFCHLRPWLRPLGGLLTWMNVILFGIECTPKCSIGPGLFLPHTVGTVIGAMEIGAGVTIFQGVTLGAAAADMGFNADLRPRIGDRVCVGAGAKVLGGVVIGADSNIGANAVLLQSIDAGSTAVGIPARVVRTITDPL